MIYEEELIDILKDEELVRNVLKLVNSVHYSSYMIGKLEGHIDNLGDKLQECYRYKKNYDGCVDELGIMITSMRNNLDDLIEWDIN